MSKKTAGAEPTFEESLRRLETIVAQLEQGDVPLDDSIRLYEEGIRLAKVCAGRLATAELTLKRLSKDLEGNLKLLDEEGEE